jgi:hypothetical protein
VGGIAPAELAAIRGRLEAFADDIFESLHAPTSVPVASATCAD